MRTIIYVLMAMVWSACSLPVDAPPPPTALPGTVSPMGIPPAVPLTAAPPPPQMAGQTQTPIPGLPGNFCSDILGTHLITEFSRAISTRDGTLLASLVSPILGLDVRYYRLGRVVNYDGPHAQDVFETSYPADWGLSSASGQTTLASFQELILPSLEKVFTPNSLIACSQIQTGHVSSMPEWPYPEMDFYSVYFPGTEEFDRFDWETWAVGMVYSSGQPYLAALARYGWEP